MRIKINSLMGLLNDAFNEMAFESVKASYTDRYSQEEKEYIPSIYISYESKKVNPNKDKYGKYLTVIHGFNPLQYGDEKNLRNGMGLAIESAERVIEVAKKHICDFDSENDYRSRIK